MIGAGQERRRLLALPVQPDRRQGVCRARSLLKGLRCEAPTRDSAPLTVILPGKRILGTATRTDRLGAVPETRVTAINHRLREGGQSPGVGSALRALPRGRLTPPGTEQTTVIPR
jgi:hypothetical protein